MGNGAGWRGFLEQEFLKPVVKSPAEIKSVIVRSEHLKYKVFMCNLSKAELKKREKTHALEYIKWGETVEVPIKQGTRKGELVIGYDSLSTLQSRSRWYDLGQWDYPDVFWSDAYNNRYMFAVNAGEYYGDKRFFLINFGKAHFLPRVYLNSSITPLFIELQGIANLGQGVIYTNVYWLKGYPVLADPSGLSSSQLKRVKQAFDQISKRDIKSIFEELGLPKPNRDYSNINARDVSLDKVLPDRRELDKIVFEAIGLTEKEQLEVYRAVVELVKNRLVKAGSV